VPKRYKGQIIKTVLHSLLSNGYQVLFPQGWSWPLTFYREHLPRSRMCGTIPPPPLHLHGMVLG